MNPNNLSLLLLAVAFVFPDRSLAQSGAFSFREYTVGDSETKHKETLHWCSKNPNGITDRFCYVRLNKLGVIAGETVIYGGIGFINDGISTMDFDLYTSSFESILSAFEKKWGNPCARSAQIVRNGVGTAFTNDTSSWCFPDGKITASRYHGKVTMMRIHFRTTRIAEFEERSPPVDF